jgi:hypothetical protein
MTFNLIPIQVDSIQLLQLTRRRILAHSWNLLLRTERGPIVFDPQIGSYREGSRQMRMP